jgi:uncharacterized protein YndB with AHSA1/START domain
MSEIKARARAVSDVVDGSIVASVEIAKRPERVFQALTTPEIIEWWVNPGVFDTREWSGDVRVGGRWSASGVARGAPYTLMGEFLEIDPPKKLVQTWQMKDAPGEPSTVTYLLEMIPGGTRLTVRHAGLVAPDQRKNIGAGWCSSFEQLAEIMSDRAK